MPVLRLADNQRNGTRNGKQLYKCMACGHQFRAGDTMTDKELWTLNRQTTNKRTGKSHYTHKRLRTAMNSVAFYLPYLFTCQEKGCDGMPNTNNKIEGVFTDLKKNLNNHSGMGEAGRK